MLRRSLPILFVLVAALVLGACGSDKEKTVTQTVNTGAETTSSEPTATIDPRRERTETTPARDEPKLADCGPSEPAGGSGTYDVKAAGPTCDAAQDVAASYLKDCASTKSGGTCNAGGYACTYVQTGDELGAVACTNAEGRLSFQIGS